MKKILLLFLTSCLLLGGCVVMSEGQASKIAATSDKTDQSIAEINRTLETMQANSDDPNKFDEAIKVTEDAKLATATFRIMANDVNDSNVSSESLLNAGRTGAAALALGNAGLGAAALGLVNLLGIWFKKPSKEAVV